MKKLTFLLLITATSLVSAMDSSADLNDRYIKVEGERKERMRREKQPQRLNALTRTTIVPQNLFGTTLDPEENPFPLTSEEETMMEYLNEEFATSDEEF